MVRRFLGCIFILTILVVAVVYRLVKARMSRKSAIMRGALQGR